MKRVFVFSPALFLAGCNVVPSSDSGHVWTAGPGSTPQPVAPPAEPPPVAVQSPAPIRPDDSEIVLAYQDVLDRQPSDRELWAWREHARREQVSLDDIRRALRDSDEFRQVMPDRVIRRAFWDYHHAAPDLEVTRLYRRRLVDEGWSISRVREDIARRNTDYSSSRDREDNRGRDNRNGDRSPGAAHGRSDGDRDARSFDAIITRAYNDVLERKPDAAGRAHYRQMLEQGLTEADVRARMRESEEYRVTLPDAKTKRAYLEVLGRAADEGGLQHYRKLIVDKGWTEEDVKNDLRRSPEYRNRHR